MFSFLLLFPLTTLCIVDNHRVLLSPRYWQVSCAAILECTYHMLCKAFPEMVYWLLCLLILHMYLRSRWELLQAIQVLVWHFMSAYWLACWFSTGALGLILFHSVCICVFICWASFPFLLILHRIKNSALNICWFWASFSFRLWWVTLKLTCKYIYVYLCLSQLPLFVDFVQALWA